MASLPRHRIPSSYHHDLKSSLWRPRNVPYLFVNFCQQVSRTQMCKTNVIYKVSQAFVSNFEADDDHQRRRRHCTGIQCREFTNF
jgi:hypothetical protein